MLACEVLSDVNGVKEVSPTLVIETLLLPVNKFGLLVCKLVAVLDKLCPAGVCGLRVVPYWLASVPAVVCELFMPAYYTAQALGAFTVDPD